MRYVQVGDATLHVETEGPSDLPKVVFVNSLGSDLRIWDDVVVALARANIGALRYDLRGHGLSDLGSPPALIDDHVSDLAAVMDQMGVARSTICGISVGGQIALGLSQRHPDKVARLILCCTGAKIGTIESWDARIAAVEKGGVGAVAEAVLRLWFPPDAYREGGGMLALARNMLSRTPAAGYVATCVALRVSDHTDAARAVRVPTLFVAGEEDGSTPPALVRGLSALVPGSQYIEIAGAGHLPCLQRPAELSGRILDFLAGNRGAVEV
jgi:3-oxoadipate enol-lactonase